MLPARGHGYPAPLASDQGAEGDLKDGRCEGKQNRQEQQTFGVLNHRAEGSRNTSWPESVRP